MKKQLVLCLLGIISYSNTFSQLPSDFYNPSVIRHKLQDLSTVGSVLYIAAHPDDENTRLISYLTKERHLRTGYLSLTKGDGGQNLIGTEQGTELGVLRSEELYAARRIDGAEQFFSSAVDFGYSKNPEETFNFWNKQEILKEVVTIIRLFRPDVIICRFPTTGEGGHGHHTASAILASEAFDLAADPNYRDRNDQPAWKVTRLLWNTFNFGTTNTTSEDQLKLDVGGFNSLLGKSYGEISAESRSQHRSQGFGSAKTRGEQFEYFKHIKGIPAKSDIMEGIDVSWNRYPALKEQVKRIKQLITEADQFIKDGKEKEAVQRLVNLRKLLFDGVQKSTGPVVKTHDPGKRLEDDNWLFNAGNEQNDILYRIRRLDEIIIAASGIHVEVLGTKQFFVLGDPVKVDINIINRGRASAFYRCAYVQYTDDCAYTDSTALIYNKSFKKSLSLENKDRNIFIGKTKMPTFRSLIVLRIEGQEVQLYLPVLFKKIDPSIGEVYSPVSVVPAVVITKMPEPVVRSGSQQFVTITLKAHKTVSDVHVKSYSSVSGKNHSDTVGTMSAGEVKTIRADYSEFWKSSDMDQQNFGLLINYRDSTGKWQMDPWAMTSLSYPHVSEWNVFHRTNMEITRINLQNKVQKVGYISGAGDKVAESLRQLGYQVDELSDEQIISGNLKQYPVIITGVRAHNTREILHAQHSKLMEYVKNGGRLIVQYNTNSRVGPLNAKIGPYPFTISRERVTDEKAEVRFINKNSAFLKMPYKIDSTDFSGWIQERSIYQVTDRDSNYQVLFSMNDPGEKASDGSLIYCKYGKGVFIYTGLVFFRELPAGVPGAYKLFINLIEAKP